MGENGEQTWVKIIVIVATFLSATLGFAAEATNLQLADVKIATDRRCTYPDHPKSPTQELGIAAIIALLVSRVYCSTRYHISSPMSRLSLISSWMAWLGAMSFYVVGLMMMQTQGEQASYRQFQPTSYTCKLVKPGIFGAGASFALTSIVLQILYLVATHHDDDTTSIPPATQSSEVTMF